MTIASRLRRPRPPRLVAGLIIGAVLASAGTGAYAASGGFAPGSFSLGCSTTAAGHVSCSGQLPVASTTTTTAPPATTTTTRPPPTTTTVAPTTTTVPATTTTSGGGASGACTSPVATMGTTIPGSGGEDTVNAFPQNSTQEWWWVDMDEWEAQPNQVMSVCSPSSWTTTYPQGVAAQGGNPVQVYPNTEYDVGGRAAGAFQANAKTPISAFAATSTFAEAFAPVSGDSWDAGYDLWSNGWSNETMVWNQWSGTQAFWPTLAGGTSGTAVTLGGVAYRFLANGTSCNTTGNGSTSGRGTCELMFFRSSQVQSGSVDLGAALRWEAANGYALSSDVPTQLEYGVEVVAAGAGEAFPLTGLTFSGAG